MVVEKVHTRAAAQPCCPQVDDSRGVVFAGVSCAGASALARADVFVALVLAKGVQILGPSGAASMLAWSCGQVAGSSEDLLQLSDQSVLADQLQAAAMLERRVGARAAESLSACLTRRDAALLMPQSKQRPRQMLPRKCLATPRHSYLLEGHSVGKLFYVNYLHWSA